MCVTCPVYVSRLCVYSQKNCEGLHTISRHSCRRVPWFIPVCDMGHVCVFVYVFTAEDIAQDYTQSVVTVGPFVFDSAGLSPPPLPLFLSLSRTAALSLSLSLSRVFSLSLSLSFILSLFSSLFLSIVPSIFLSYICMLHHECTPSFICVS